MKNHKAFTLLSLFISIFFGCSAPGDEEEEFGKDDFTNQLPWAGETDKFVISAKEGIHLNDPQEDAGTAYVTTPLSSVRNTRWEFGVRLTFNPSAQNYARFYLASSSQKLSDALNGYFIQIGGAKDNVTLYRQNGTQPKLLASGRELMKGNSSPKLWVKVECDHNGYWTFWTRSESESDYTLEKQVQDTSIQSSICCGVYCVYTKSRYDGFTFHHIQLSNDVETIIPPEETPEEPETPSNPDVTELPEDVRGMLFFNEVMYDNATNGAEYVEIYNPTNQTLVIQTLYLYKTDPATGKVYSTTSLGFENSVLPLSIPAKSYLCFTKSVSKLIQRHKVGSENLIEIAKFPQLNNDGGSLALSSSETPSKGHTFDTCLFNHEIHDTNASSTIGISLEKKSPELSSLKGNWHSCTHTSGGTPGIKNSGL